MHKHLDPNSLPAELIDFNDFLKVDVRAGTIVSAAEFAAAKKPAYKLEVSFGRSIGILKSSAQITENYALDTLPGMRVCAVVNFPPRQIGPLRSDVLILGFADATGAILLLQPAAAVPDGARLA